MMLDTLIKKTPLIFIVLFCQVPYSFAEELKLGTVSTSTPKQIVKELTASTYIFETKNDFDRDGKPEHVIGADCIEGFCENYIFKDLKNHRVQYMGKAKFHHNAYELVWTPSPKGFKEKLFADVIYFKQQNIGQGCLGRYHYKKSHGYELISETCRLPKEVIDILASYRLGKVINVEQVDEERERPKNMDFIDFSDIEYNDDPEDFFPEEPE